MPSAPTGVAFLIDPASQRKAYRPARARSWRHGALPAFGLFAVLILALAWVVTSPTDLADICGQASSAACGP